MNTTCKSCGAEIFFIKTKSGRFAPVDADITVSTGKELLYVDEIIGFKMIPEGFKGHKSHFATCPNAVDFRKGKK